MFATEEQAKKALIELLNGTTRDNDLVPLAVTQFPDSALIQFLAGSYYASHDEVDVALDLMGKSVQLAPTFYLAQFQLGFLSLTAGHIELAQQQLTELLSKIKQGYLCEFAQGLMALIEGDEPNAIRHIEQGIVLNEEVAPLNTDMRHVISTLSLTAERDSASLPEIEAPHSPLDSALSSNALLHIYNKPSS
ncbi:tetratricopeptide repeat protein [Colwellia sp. MEBiC06753]